MAVSYVDPSRFDAKYYTSSSPDLAGMNDEQALSHYLNFGQAENRAYSAESARATEIQAAVARGELNQDQALDLLVDEQISTQKGDDFGSLAKPSYRSFTPYDKPAPEYTPRADFKMEDYVRDPGYQFRKDEGNKAIDRGQAARGGFYSGGAIKEAQRFAQGLATEEFGNTYGRYVDGYNRDVNDFNIASGEHSKRYNEHGQNFSTGYNQATNDQNTLYSRLSGITNAGMGATNTAANANASNANAQAGIIGQAADASAAATLNQGNQITSALSRTFGGGSSYGQKPGATFPTWG